MKQKKQSLGTFFKNKRGLDLITYLSDSLPLNLHHSGRDGVGAGLQAAVLTLETAHVHWVQEHLLAVLRWKNKGVSAETGLLNVIKRTR